MEPLSHLTQLSRLDASGTTASDSAEFDAFYRSYFGGIFAHLLRIGAKPSDAEDLTQEAMLRTWAAWRRLAGAEHRRKYAFTCAVTE